MKNKAKKHHYISQFFLKNFSSDGKSLWVFDRYKKEYRFQSIKEIAHENKFYSYTSKDGEENLESVLSQVEGIAKPILQKIIKKGTNYWPRKGGFINVSFSYVCQST